ncbi:MAG: threonine/serine dehydratase, partial [Agromyces sp.]
MTGPTREELIAARETVGKIARVTPIESSEYLARVLGSPVWLKCENLQRTGAYKIRGAYNRLSKLTAEERARGVVAASAGNHAQGVSLAARELGIAATIFMPIGVALPKLEATRAYGAEVVLNGTIFAETLEAAKAFALETGAVFIPPYDHPDVIAGQASVGFEILEQVPNVDTVVVPIGGGGLIAGVAAAIKLEAALQASAQTPSLSRLPPPACLEQSDAPARSAQTCPHAHAERRHGVCPQRSPLLWLA